MKFFKKEQDKPFIILTIYGFAYLLLIVNIFALGFHRTSAPFHTVGLTLIVFGLVAMIQSNSNMQGLSGKILPIEPAEEHQDTQISAVISQSKLTQSYHLKMSFPKNFSTYGSAGLPVLDDSGILRLRIRTPARGVYPVGRFKVASSATYGLFYVWQWFNTDAELLVYPKPDGHLPLPQDTSAQMGRRQQGEDFAGHKPYIKGASLKQVDWKAYARGRELLLKDFDAGVNEGPVHLDLAKTPGQDMEAQLRQLSAWVFTCNMTSRSYSLKLGKDMLALGQGEVHLRQALRMLAVYQEAA